MKSVSRLRIALLAGAAAALPLSHTQAQAPANDGEAPLPIDEGDEADGEEIVVVGQKDPNAVIGNIPPENQLDARDVRALGATNVAELLDSIAPQTSSGRGREGGGAPVVLLNGRRISGFREVRDLPSEAILRVDILPEEVALKYGYRADQRVVNIILRPRFRSTTTRVEGETPTDSGRFGGEADATQLLIVEASRTSLNVRAESVSSLLESERDIRFTPADPDELDPRPFRTLEGSRRLARIGGNHNRTLFGDVSTTFDGQLEWTDGRTLLGPSLTEPGDPLRRDSDSLSGHLGLAMNGEKSRWRWSLTGVYDILRSTSETDRETSDLIFSQDHSRSLSQSGNLDLVLNGSPFDLPAGPASATIRFGGAAQDLESRTRTRETDLSSDLGRRRLSSAINVDLPIAKRNGTLSPLGNLSLNANAEVEHLSDFGGLWVVGTGITWSPIQRLNLIVSWTREQGAPSLQQLGDPLQLTPKRRVFDFVTGETVLVDALTGGNPNLDSDTRNVVKLGATYAPFPDVDLNLRADFVHERITDPIARFPGPTEAIEEAFPDRFQRDAEGNLIRVDQRPVNFESSARDELRWGFNFTKPLQSKRPPQAFIDQMRALRQQGGGGAPTGAAGDRPTQARAGGGSGGRFGGGSRGGQDRGRLQLSIYHTLLLKDEVQIGPEVPTLDYLDGEPFEGGIRPRHRLEVEAGWYNNGLGARLSADWQSGGRVRQGEADDLKFSPLATFDLRLFANLGERFELLTKYPWLRGTQVRFSVDNLFNAHQRVRDEAGQVPVNYQPDLLDPLGRAISVSIRKAFLPPRGSFRREQPASNR